VVRETTYYWKFSDGTAEISVEELRSLLGQLESELRHSDLYQQIVAGLQGLPEDVSQRVQKMVNAIGKAGVQLALRKLVTKKIEQPITPQATMTEAVSQPSLPPSPQRLSQPSQLDDTPIATMQSADSTSMPEAVANKSSLTEPRRFTVAIANKRSNQQPPKRLTKREQADQAKLEGWRDRLREIGQTLQQARQAKSLSLYHLHFKTQIPLHRLESLEAGNAEQLAEDDIYIRGFIRRAADALGLDGADLANSLPVLDAAKSVLPNWQRSPRQTGKLQLGTMHLYVGYAALLAGGIGWLSYQTNVKQAKPLTSVEPVPAATAAPDAKNETPPPASNATRSPASDKQANKAKSFAQKEAVNLNSIAPPEISNGLESRSLR